MWQRSFTSTMMVPPSVHAFTLASTGTLSRPAIVDLITSASMHSFKSTWRRHRRRRRAKLSWRLAKTCAGTTFSTRRPTRLDSYPWKSWNHFFDSCKELNSPNLRNRVTTFKHLRRFGVMDGITKLRGLSNWAYV